MKALFVVTWVQAANRPDSDVTVLLAFRSSDHDDDLAVEAGYWDSEDDCWRLVDASPLDLADVVAWCDLPVPPVQMAPPAPVSEERQTVALVACCKTKLPEAAPARRLYCGPIFRARMAHIERRGVPWVVMSALHGLVLPDQFVVPYEFAMSGRTKLERVGHGERVTSDLLAWIGRVTTGLVRLEIHAGADYADCLDYRALKAAGVEVVRMTQGMGIGQQLAWYGAESKKADRCEALLAEVTQLAADATLPTDGIVSGPRPPEIVHPRDRELSDTRADRDWLQRSNDELLRSNEALVDTVTRLQTVEAELRRDLAGCSRELDRLRLLAVPEVCNMYEHGSLIGYTHDRAFAQRWAEKRHNLAGHKVERFWTIASEIVEVAP